MIVLDTHAWIWLNDDAKRLSDGARKAIRRESELGVSTFSLWEVAMLCQYGRIKLDRPLQAWLEKACSLTGIRILPLTIPVVARVAQLNIHGDPADRVIVASALVHQCALVTRDESIQESGVVKTIW